MQWGEDSKEAIVETEAQSRYLLSLRSLFNEKGWREDRVDRKLDSIKRGQFYFADCPAIKGGQMTVLADGSVGVCQVEASSVNQTILGNIKQQSLSDCLKSAKWDSWLEVSTLNNAECLECPGLPICGGGCPVEAQMMYGSRKAIDRPFCAHTMTVLDWVLDQVSAVKDLGTTKEEGR